MSFFTTKKHEKTRKLYLVVAYTDAIASVIYALASRVSENAEGFESQNPASLISENLS